MSGLPEPERHHCLFCEKTYLNPDTVVSHCAREHHPSLSSVTAIYGTYCPVCNKKFGRLSQHCSVTHKRQITYLFHDVLQTGDPHGVVAARIQHYTQLHVAEPVSATIPLSADDMAKLVKLAFQWDISPQQALRWALDLAESAPPWYGSDRKLDPRP